MFKAVNPGQSALPLSALTAVVLDTETTGLNTKADFIVQIGAVQLSSGRLDRTMIFDELVNPGVTIPASSTSIHGIGDQDVVNAKTFVQVMPRLAEWASGCIVLGWSIGFDLAILKREHLRAGLAWQPPRSLDVAHLVQFLSPNLPSVSLEAVAGWLSVDIRDRHNAIADALITAEIFVALLPLLHAKGVFTLAEAERACRTLTAKMDEEVEAGWQEPVVPKRRDTFENRFGWTKVDSFPYRHRLGEIMRKPAVVLAEDTKVGEVLRLMTREQISSVFLMPPKDGEGHSILTERDILRAISREGAQALEQSAAAFRSRPLVTLGEKDFAYRAIRRMATAGFRHLGVHDEEGELVGALSARDLLKWRAGEVVSLGEEIEKANSPSELGTVWSGLASVAEALVQEDVDVRDIAAIISEELRTMTKRACEIAEREFMESDKGAPPVPYAMLVLGSGGRGESLLAMDQDNAVVYEGGEADDTTDQWFEAFGGRVAAILDEAGVAYCEGGVMASNAAWRKSLAEWRRTVADWIKINRPENLLSADIFFDGCSVHGTMALGDGLLSEALEAAGQSPPFLSALAARAGDFEDPMGWFGRFKLTEGRLDLKKSGLLALFSTARVLALRHGITRHSTAGRFRAVQGRLDQAEGAITDLVEAHRTILDAILRQQLRDLAQGIPLSNSVAPSSLTGLQRENLKWALGRIGLTNNLLGIPAKL